MKYDWRQLSPQEKDAMLRYFILHQSADAPVTAEKICQAMQKTHFLSCVPQEKGNSIFQFLPGSAGKGAGAAIAEDTTEGIYKAALRTSGVNVFDPRERSSRKRA